MTHTIELRRLPDWPERLAAYLDQHRLTPFEWGTHDCVLFAAGAVGAMTGNHGMLPGTWSDRAHAAQLLRRLGGLVPAVDRVLPRLPGPQWAQRGDLLLVQTPTPIGGLRRWIGVADGRRWWAPSATGLTCGSVAQAVQAWGVAHG